MNKGSDSEILNLHDKPKGIIIISPSYRNSSLLARLSGIMEGNIMNKFLSLVVVGMMTVSAALAGEAAAPKAAAPAAAPAAVAPAAAEPAMAPAPAMDTTKAKKKHGKKKPKAVMADSAAAAPMAK